MRLIAVAGAPWSGARAIAEEVARLADFRFVGPEAVSERLRAAGLAPPWEHDTPDGGGPADAGPPALRDVAVDLLSRDGVVGWGWGAELLFADDPAALTVWVNASWERRLARCAAETGLADVEAARRLVADEERVIRWRARCFRTDGLPPAQFALAVRSDLMDPRAAAELIVHAAEAVEAGVAEENGEVRAAAPGARAQPATAGAGTPPKAGAAGVRFAHPSEAELARLLDFYQVAWLYEPKTFPLRWDGEGNVTEAFTPDFYLPELDLYLELTTLKQSLVTKKNRKLRRLRELYSDVQVKVLYGQDFRQLLRKYGLAPDGPEATGSDK